MDARPRQVLQHLLAQYEATLYDQPGRCRDLLLDALQARQWILQGPRRARTG